MGEKAGRQVPEIGLGEEGEDAADDADDVSRAAVVEDPGELERRVGHQLEQRNDLPALSLGCCASRKRDNGNGSAQSRPARGECGVREGRRTNLWGMG